MDTLVIDRVLMHKTAHTGPWLFCFEAKSAESRNFFNIPGREYGGDQTNIPMDLRLNKVREGTNIAFLMRLDNVESRVCTPHAVNESSGSFPASISGAQMFYAGDDWAYSIYWHLEPQPDPQNALSAANYRYQNS